jgi:hypothetical protein
VADNQKDELHAFAPMIFFVPFTWGWAQATELLGSTTQLIDGAAAGSTAVLLAAILTFAAALLSGFRGFQPWLWVVAAYALDLLISALLLLPARGVAMQDPLALYPYLAGSAATVMAAAWLGFNRGWRVWDYAIAFASLDLLVGAADGLLGSRPLPLTAALLSRIFVSYAAAAIGVWIGIHARLAYAHRGRAARQMGWVLCSGIVTSAIGGALATLMTMAAD